MQPVCFIVMPFGVKADPAGGTIDFDLVYRTAIEPGVRGAGLQPVRADMEQTGGIIHKEMFERLVLADFAVADLTTANANVFYELGVRHTARPRTTLPLVASHHRIPFDLTFLRALPYDLGPGNEFGPELQGALRDAITARLTGLRDLAATSDAAADSPLFQLMSGWRPAPLDHLKTDVFRERVAYREQVRQQLADARDLAAEGDRDAAAALLDQTRDEVDPSSAEVGVLIDLLLSERALSRWEGMVELVDRFPADVRRQVLVREQLAMALNRMSEQRARPSAERRSLRRRAVALLEELLEEHGPSPETLGLLGRAHKASWIEAREQGELSVDAHLRRSIDAYVRGFRADPRDGYPGVNAVTLLSVAGSPEDRQLAARIAPVVRFMVEEQRQAGSEDYWSWATTAELSAAVGDLTTARHDLGHALACAHEGWYRETTAQNLDLLASSPTLAPDAASELAALAAQLRGRS